MPGLLRCTCGDYTRVLTSLRTRGCGCIGHPAFPAPSVCWANDFCKTSGASRREIAKPYFDGLRFGCLKREASVRKASRGACGDRSHARAPLTLTAGCWCSASRCRARPARGCFVFRRRDGPWWCRREPRACCRVPCGCGYPREPACWFSSAAWSSSVSVADGEKMQHMLTAFPQIQSSFRDGPKDQTSDVQLHIGESRDSGFIAARCP